MLLISSARHGREYSLIEKMPQRLLGASRQEKLWVGGGGACGMLGKASEQGWVIGDRKEC